MQDQATPRVFRVSAVAGMYDVSKSTIYRAVGTGQLDALRLGTGKGAIRILEPALTAWVRACALEPRRSQESRVSDISCAGGVDA